MKKPVFIILIFNLSILAFSQDDIGLYISYLGKPVPNDFHRVNRTTYMNDNGIILHIHDGLVISSVIGVALDYTHEAIQWLADYYNFFEDQQWTFLDSDLKIKGDAYAKDGIIAICIKPSKRDDNLITTMVILTKEEYADMF